MDLIIENLSDGRSEQEILAAYPSLTVDDIHAVRAYADESARR